MEMARKEERRKYEEFITEHEVGLCALGYTPMVYCNHRYILTWRQKAEKFTYRSQQPNRNGFMTTTMMTTTMMMIMKLEKTSGRKIAFSECIRFIHFLCP